MTRRARHRRPQYNQNVMAKTDVEFLNRERQFLDSLESVLSAAFREAWIPVFAKTCYRATHKLPNAEKAVSLKRVLVALSDWESELRIKVLRDLARFVRMNRAIYKGNEKKWMEKSCCDTWASFIREEDYLEWCAAACDDTDDLEVWRAPVWLAAALGISEKDIRLQEKPEQQEVVSISRFNPTELEDCDRLDREYTDKLISTMFLSESIVGLCLSQREFRSIEELHILLAQGAKISPGLHDTGEDSPVAAALFGLTQNGLVFPTAKPVRRHRVKSPYEREREKEIWKVIQEGHKGVRYALAVDGSGVKIPTRWVERECPASYVKAYMAGNPWRHNIVNEKWSIKRKYDQVRQPALKNPKKSKIR